MNTTPPFRLVLAGLLLIASCVQPGLSPAALDLQSRRQAAREARVAVEHFRGEPAANERAPQSSPTTPRAKDSTRNGPATGSPAGDGVAGAQAEVDRPRSVSAPDAGQNSTHATNRRRFTLRGYVLSSTAERATDASEPLVVYAERQGSTVSDGESISQLDLPVVLHGEQAPAPGFTVSSVGGAVRIKNVDDICHAYFSTSGTNAFDLGVLAPGQSREVTFEQQGIVHIYCTLHEGKQASVLVVPTRHHTIVAEDGSFAIARVPAGEYMLSTWSPKLPTRQRRVTVTDEQPQPILIDLKLEQGGGTE